MSSFRKTSNFLSLAIDCYTSWAFLSFRTIVILPQIKRQLSWHFISTKNGDSNIKISLLTRGKSEYVFLIFTQSFWLINYVKSNWLQCCFRTGIASINYIFFFTYTSSYSPLEGRISHLMSLYLSYFKPTDVCNSRSKAKHISETLQNSLKDVNADTKP